MASWTCRNTVVCGILFVVALAESRLSKDKRPSCDEFNMVVMRFYRDYITPQFEADYDLREMLPYFLGVVWEDLADVNKFSCKLAGVYNLKALAKLVHMPYPLLRDHYESEVAAIRKQGGPQGLSYQLSLRESLVPAAQMAGLPDWPLRLGQAQVRGCLQVLVARYGRDFLQRYMANWPLRHPILITDVEEFSRQLVAAHSADDFAFRMNLDVDDVNQVEYSLAYDIEEWSSAAPQFRSYVMLVNMADSLGLLNLPP